MAVPMATDTPRILGCCSAGQLGSIHSLIEAVRHLDKSGWSIDACLHTGQRAISSLQGCERVATRGRSPGATGVYLVARRRHAQAPYSPVIAVDAEGALYAGADVGIALYSASATAERCRNLEVIGLSSGKLSTYLHSRLPVVATVANGRS